jgi:hypothetical protein
MLAINSCVIESSFDAKTIQAEQQPSAQLLIDRMVPIADRGLCHLGGSAPGCSAAADAYGTAQRLVAAHRVAGDAERALGRE